MRIIILRLSFILLLLLICLYLATSFFSITELLYPAKLDSIYVHTQQLQYEKELDDGKLLPEKTFLYNPSQLNLISNDFSILTHDQIKLKGWYIVDSVKKSQNTLIIIPDINESKISYIEAASEFIARGINVCLMDMRAQGESEGTFYTMGKITLSDVMVIIDSLISINKTQNIVLMGVGTGAAIALQAAEEDQRIKVLLLQNPFFSLEEYIASYAKIKYGRLSKWFYGRMKKDFEKEIGFSADSLNLSILAAKVKIPTLFISVISEKNLEFRPTERLFDVSIAVKKEWGVFIKQDENNKGLEERKKYYDKAAAFINSNVQQKTKSKFRKLVLN